MRKLLTIIFLFISLSLSATTYYIATTGSDGNVGSLASPWASWQKAFNTANAGDIVYFRGGTYYSTSPNLINPTTGHGYTGTKANPITYMSYPGEWAILDCFHHCTGALPQYNQAIYIQYAEYLRFKDFEVRNVFQCDSVISGAISAAYSRNLTFEHIVVHQVAQRAFYIQGGAWKSYYDEGNTTQVPYWSTPYDTTSFINCDVYDLCDTLSSRIYPKPGNNADGWKTTHYKGNYVLWRNNRIWNYSDDAIDPTPGNGAYLIFDGNWVMSSKKYSAFPYMEGNGLKIASYSTMSTTAVSKGQIIIKGNLVVFCAAIGITNNLFVNATTQPQNKASIYNNTVYKSYVGFDEFGYTGIHDSTTYKNNLGYNCTLYYGHPNNFYGSNLTTLFESHNTADWVGGWPGWEDTDTVTVTNADFVTTDSLTLVSLFTASRQADGSLPTNKPLQLVVGSDLINAGIDVGLDYNSTAPDLGYVEYGTVDATANDILSFTFTDIVGVSVINATTHAVTAVLQAGEDITDIEPTISVSTGATIDPLSGASGDFTNPVVYTVTAEDLGTQAWTVTITEDTDPVPTVATVATLSANVKSVMATVYGNVYSLNGGTFSNKGVCWSTSESPTISDDIVYAGTGIGAFNATIRGLAANTTYHARAFCATSEGGASYGSDVEFKTPKYSVPVNGSDVLIYNNKIVIVK